MIKYISSGILLGLAILFACLYSVWTGFSYFALAFGCALCLMWAIIWIVDYFYKYKRENLDERYKIYCAVLINSSALTLDLIQKSDKIFYKKFKRTLIKEKFICWIKICFAIGFFIALFFVFF